jgi:hypothetical protein
VHALLHPDLRKEELPVEISDLAGVRDLLLAVSEQVPGLTQSQPSAEPSPDRTKIVAAVLELLTRLGWQPDGRSRDLERIWEDLAKASHDRVAKVQFLRRALGSAESMRKINHLRDLINELSSRTPEPGLGGQSNASE